MSLLGKRNSPYLIPTGCQEKQCLTVFMFNEKKGKPTHIFLKQTQTTSGWRSKVKGLLWHTNSPVEGTTDP
jgi:hypothetical protein